MNVAILGAGAMGNVLAQTVKEQGGQVAGMVEARNGETLAALEGPVDVVIDFSNPANLDMLIDYFEKREQIMISFEPETFDMMIDKITANQNELTFHLLGGVELKEKI